MPIQLNRCELKLVVAMPFNSWPEFSGEPLSLDNFKATVISLKILGTLHMYELHLHRHASE